LELTESEALAVVHREIAERRAAAEEYERLDRVAEAVAVRYEADVLARVCAGVSPDGEPGPPGDGR
jgi:uncharacterized protein YqeY